MTLSNSSQPTLPPFESNLRAGMHPITLRALLGALIVFLFVLAMNFPFPPHSPLAGTEGHRGLTAHGMVQSGQWLVPRLLGRVYLAKPPLHYWLQATAETLTGSSAEFIWRIPAVTCSALMAAVLALFSARWFGERAGILSGFAYASMVALWATSRSADIDITDVLVSNIAAICVLEIYFGTGRRTAVWIVAACLFFWLTFMAKGPGGLPILLGSMLCVAAFAVREKQFRFIVLPKFWLPLVVGLFGFAYYAYAVYRFLVSHQMTLDWSGLQEGAMDLHPHDWSFKRFYEWVLLAPILFVYTVPASLALPLMLVPEIRGDTIRSRRMRAVAWTVISSWFICFVSGMHLPRYAYVTLPLLCPLSGAVWADLGRYPLKWQKLLWDILRVAAVVFTIATVVTALLLWKHHAVRAVLAVAIIVSVSVAVFILPGLSRSHRTIGRLWLAPLLLLTPAVVGSCGAHYDRLRRSGQEWGQEIRQITGPGVELMGGALILDQPEVFYYSGLKPHPYDGDNVDWRDVHQSGWIVLEDQELAAWKKEVPQRISREHPKVVNKNNATFLWYDVTIPLTGAATQPDGARAQP